MGSDDRNGLQVQQLQELILENKTKETDEKHPWPLKLASSCCIDLNFADKGFCCLLNQLKFVLSQQVYFVEACLLFGEGRKNEGKSFVTPVRPTRRFDLIVTAHA